MTDFTSLKFLDLFGGLFRALRIDYPTLRMILQMKLTMDKRRVPTILQGSTNNKKKKESNQFVKSLWIYLLYGLMLIPFLFIGHDDMFQMSIIFGITMFILMTSMISDFSSVLLDVRDQAILRTKPIDERTINVAKMIHVAIYMSMLTAAFILVGSVTMIVTKGISFFLIFFVEMILLVLFILALTALVYIFVLHFFDGERLKNIINYIQIILSIGIIVGYQIVVRAFDLTDIHVAYTFSWWHYLVPPFWFAAPFKLIFGNQVSITFIILTMLAILVPIIAIIVYLKMMPRFEQNIQKLMEASASLKKKKRPLSRMWERLLCSGREERLFFRFSNIVMGNEREFKLRVYPLIGMSFVFPFIFLFNSLTTESYTAVVHSKAYFNIYFVNLMVAAIIHMFKYSANYKGAWIFQVIPSRHLEHFYRATLKVFLVKLYLPIYLLLSIAFVGIFSYRIIPDLLVVFVTAILFSGIVYRIINNEQIPFTHAFETAQEAGNGLKMFIAMIFVGIFAVIHIAATFIPYGVWIYFALLCIVTWITWRVIFREKVALQL